MLSFVMMSKAGAEVNVTVTFVTEVIYVFIQVKYVKLLKFHGLVNFYSL